MLARIAAAESEGAGNADVNGTNPATVEKTRSRHRLIQTVLNQYNTSLQNPWLKQSLGPN